ncbi:eukaryotic translation initiation factor 3 subunit J [Fomitopsis serialis]|uniref:eukaryotic translation initiation factor 3 subunit J n=1 Tax=Fomitopsis serialis TaxID=139415 RepID=UPI002008A9DC|nr:eukaryotic translation initiation factor 3 subunit J [Neoantrodia serialis]KAH9921888.1 eukaryotic translation initiation factor 3 subunit J [Neoantrodia serialis]
MSDWGVSIPFAQRCIPDTCKECRRVRRRNACGRALCSVPKKPVKSKWEGEDDDGDAPVSDWEASSDEEEKPAKPAAPVAAPKKKGTLKQKLAEKEAARAARIAAGEEGDYDEDAVLDPREKMRIDKERELNSDLNNAADLLGAAALGGTSSSELDELISAQPRVKEDFIKLSNQIIQYIIKRHQDKPLYTAFVEHHVRKTASVLTTLANEKQKEQRDKASGKKKPKATTKPVLGAAKVASKLDTSVYDEALDDFGSNADDGFM